ncbi:MAG TPA: dialkylresorcinol condensing enzyme [Kiritimatiellia bacterium]
MKRILVIYYSQTGQLRRILDSMLAPLGGAAGVEITWWDVQPAKPYPFPWPVPRFLDVFPESVLMVPPELKPLPAPPREPFDLVVLAYTVWYLAPSPPISAFLQSPAADVLRGRPVITVVNARDKWLTAQEMVKDQLAKLGAKLIDNVAFIHAGNPLQHTVTTLRWMWTGKKEAFGSFPAAGVSETDIRAAQRFGEAICRALEQGTLAAGGPTLKGLGAVSVDNSTVLQEEIARVVFRCWARWIRAAGRMGRIARSAMLLLFGACLLVLLLLAAPLVLLLMPFLRKSLPARCTYYEQPSGGHP